MPLTAFASIAPGLEPLLADELRELGLRPRIEEGGVSFPADLEAVMVANLYSRLAGRITLVLGTCKAAKLEGLAAGVRQLPWRDWIPAGQAVETKVSAKASRLRNREAIGAKVVYAIKDAMRGPRKPGPRPPRTPALVVVNLDRDQATLGIDTSGELLHRRGWRKATAKAPLRENYAAALLKAADWAPDEALVDPMCGAGTFPIEAATIAAGLPPGNDRSFGFEAFPCLDHKLWARIRTESRLPATLGSAPIVAADRDPGAIKATRSNASRARVDRRIVLKTCSLADLEPPTDTGLIILNPPWGTRVHKGGPSSPRGIAEVLKQRWVGWRAAILLPERIRIGLDVEPVVRFSSGGIRVHLLVTRGKLTS